MNVNSRAAHRLRHSMRHRNLSGSDLTAFAIDDVIVRGDRSDWFELRGAALADFAVFESLRRICEARKNAPYDAARYRYWLCFAEEYADAGNRG